MVHGYKVTKFLTKIINFIAFAKHFYKNRRYFLPHAAAINHFKFVSLYQNNARNGNRFIKPVVSSGY